MLKNKTITAIFPLYNFSTPIDTIVINDKIEIVTLKDPLKKLLYDNCLLKNEIIKKISLLKHALIYHDYGPNRGISMLNLETILHIYKKNELLHLEFFSYDKKNNKMRWLSYSRYIPIVFSKKGLYIIGKSEQKKFINYINRMIKLVPRIENNFSALLTALRQYNASHNDRTTLKILRFSTFFEALLMKDSEMTEITYKISIRLAYLIGKNYSERKKIISFFKGLYGLRSKIIHGRTLKNLHVDLDGKKYLFLKFLEYSEKIIRKCIKEYMTLIKKFNDPEEIINYLDDLIIGKQIEK